MNSFVPLDQVTKDVQIGTRGTKILSTPRGGYLSLETEGKNLFLVMGTRQEPVTTTAGIHKLTTNGNDWHSLSVNLSEDRIHNLEYVDQAIAQYLADQSVELFKVKLTADQITQLKYYEPLVRYNEDGTKIPTFSSKIHDDLQIVDANNNPIHEADLTDAVKPGAWVRVVFKLDCLYFKSANSCKVRVWAMNVQVLKQGEKQPDFAFD